MSGVVSKTGAVNPLNGPLRILHLVTDDSSMSPLAGYESWLRVNNCCANTVQDRVGVLADFARTHPSFPDVTPGQITNWLGREGYAQWTRGAYFGHLRSYYTFAMSVGIVDVDPMLGMKRPKKGKSVPRPLTPEQVATVMAAARPNTAAWLTLGLFAGLRAHEIAKIRGEDVEEDQLYVFGKGGQGAYVPTHPKVWALALTRPRFGWWFPTSSAAGHVTNMSVSTTTSRLFAANGIEGSLHRCRHTFATELLRQGENIRVVQQLMRHESLTSTQMYTAVDECELRSAIRRLAA
jgi:integrase/recombinase XerD